MKVTIENIREIIIKADIIDVDSESIAKDKSLFDQGMDSLDIMAIFLEIEDEYGIRIPDEDYEKLLSVDQIVTYLNGRFDRKVAKA